MSIQGSDKSFKLGPKKIKIWHVMKTKIPKAGQELWKSMLGETSTLVLNYEPSSLNANDPDSDPDWLTRCSSLDFDWWLPPPCLWWFRFIDTIDPIFMQSLVPPHNLRNRSAVLVGFPWEVFFLWGSAGDNHHQL